MAPSSRKYRDSARAVRLRPRCGSRWPPRMTGSHRPTAERAGVGGERSRGEHSPRAGFLTQIPLRRPSQGVLGDVGRIGQPGIAEVAGRKRAPRRRGCVRGRDCGLCTSGVGESLAEAGFAVDLDQQRREMDLGSRAATAWASASASPGTCSAGRGDTIRSPSSPRRARPPLAGSASTRSRSVTAA